MTKILSAINFLKGKKTYIVGIAMIVVGLYEGNLPRVLEGLGLMTLRNAI